MNVLARIRNWLAMRRRDRLVDRYEDLLMHQRAHPMDDLARERFFREVTSPPPGAGPPPVL
jgi:hypothetical protein